MPYRLRYPSGVESHTAGSGILVPPWRSWGLASMNAASSPWSAARTAYEPQRRTTEEDEHRQFVASSTASLDATLRFHTIETFYTTFINIGMAGRTAVARWIGATRVLAGQLTVGEVLVFLSYLASLYAPLNTLLQTWGLIQGGHVSAERVFEILETAPDVVDEHRGLTRGEVHGAVTFEGVVFGYSSTTRRAAMSSWTGSLSASSNCAPSASR
jgi:ABC-type multidrug transport system fused ATPase/permease subunit